MRVTLVACMLAAASAPAFAVEVDGRIDPAEWQGAQHITDFRLTQPMSRVPAAQTTEAWILATPQGLAVAFRNAQPAALTRNRSRGQRDNAGPVDRVNLFVDFDGEGRNGYNFTVSLANSINDLTITNENQFNPDWDAEWKHATSEDDAAWYVEMLIPWYVAPMRSGVDGKRKLGISLDRVVSVTGERVSWPAVTFTEPRFLTAFETVEVPEYNQALFAITPYVSGIHDLVANGNHFDAGADIFWKPSGKFQLSATLNPDFGQVESDDLVVNFSATESFFSDKRPFFTENQGFFDVTFGSLNQRSRLIYTRRVGGPADDGQGSGDVTAAIKANGSAAGFNYGVFAATEGDEVGRDFYALRATRDFTGDGGQQGIGAMVTRVERPFLDRTATVYETDHRWSTDQWNVRTTLVGSDIVQSGVDARDSGAQVIADYDMGNDWRQQLYAVHIGRDLDLRDFGYLERNNFNYARYELGHRVNHFGETSTYSGANWKYAVSRRSNDQGEFISYAASVDRLGQLRDGGNDLFQTAAFTRGHDDIITRGHGTIDVPEKFYAYYERNIARKGKWDFYGYGRYAAEGLGTIGQGSVEFWLQPVYNVRDNFNITATLQAIHNPAWLIWRSDDFPSADRLGTYRSNQLYLSTGATWLIDDKRELRVRLEAIGLDAHALQSYHVDSDGTPVPIAQDIPDFALRNLGFQVRYRYEFAPLSYLYVAYVRGGSLFQSDLGDPYSVGGEFRDAFDLRDSEQLLVKVSYRFEL
ncbi:MAG: DUF5916 domain-containing protein [Luteimonas sp.]